MQKVKGFTLIESIIALTIAGVVSAGAIQLKLDDIELENSKKYANDLNSVINAVDQRISVDGYDISLWDKKSWSTLELKQLVNNQLQAINSKCNNGTWTPTNGEDELQLINCSTFEKNPFDMNVEAELVEDSLGYIKEFNLSYSFQNVQDFEENFQNFKNTFRSARAKKAENVTGTVSYSLINKLNDAEIGTAECIRLTTDCAFEVSLDRLGGSEYVRADGTNSMINSTLSFIDAKGNAPLKCLRWSKDESDVWTKKIDEECGIGIYENGARMVVDLAGDTATYQNILLDKECKKYKYNGFNVVEDGVSPCGIINNGTEIYQVVENVHSKNMTVENGEFNDIHVYELEAATVSSQFVEASNRIKTDLIESFSGSTVKIDDALLISESLTINGTQILATNANLYAKSGRFYNQLRTDTDLVVMGNHMYGPNSRVTAKEAVISENLWVQGNQLDAGDAAFYAKTGHFYDDVRIKGDQLDARDAAFYADSGRFYDYLRVEGKGEFLDEVTMNDALKLEYTITTGANCYTTTGAIARDSEGHLHSCISGSWQKPSTDLTTKKGFSSISGLITGKNYLVSVYGVTSDKGTGGGKTLDGIRITDGSNLLGYTPSVSVNWPDGNAPQSATLIIRAPWNGYIRGYTDGGLAKSMTAVQLN